jgi:hypothetical protein
MFRAAPASARTEAILGAISAAQASLGGDEAELRERLSRLLDREPPETLVIAAQAVGRILQAEGCGLPATERDREGTDPPPTLH